MKDLLMLPAAYFKNKTYIITGGGTGLGKSFAEALLYLGANVMIASRKEEKLKAACEELRQKTSNSNILYTICDVRNYEDVERLLSDTLQKFTKIEGIINNAAGNFITPTENLSSKGFDTIIDIVLKGSYNTSLALGKHWIAKAEGGTILNIVTTYAESGSPYVVPSATAKAGVVALTKSLASEWGKYGIRCNAVAPGLFPTEGAWDRLLPAEIRGAFDVKKKVPLQRLGSHDELANLVTYLLSDFSSYINGSIVTIDGGEYNFGASEFGFLSSLSKDMWQQIEKTIRNSNKGN